jgi:hypothetical protein
MPVSVSLRAARAALALVALGAGCSVRADLGGGDGASSDAGDAKAAMDAASLDVAAEAMPEAPPDANDSRPAAEALDAALVGETSSDGVEAGAPSCDDNVLDGDETDIDCGGSCAPCGLAQKCRATSDCGTWPGCDPLLGCACDAQTQTCVVNHCVDERQDFGETAVDCGGGECGGCGPNKACVLDSDCSATLSGCGPGGCTCDVPTRTCVYDHCFDHKSDSDETGIDCGGITCGGCALGVACGYDGDCASLACDGVSLTCVSSQCDDRRQDGIETDVDCGGGTCGGCTIGQKCKVSFDCASGVCSTGTPHVCF